MRATNMREVAIILREYSNKIHAKADHSDPNFMAISIVCEKVCCILIFVPSPRRIAKLITFSLSDQRMVRPILRRELLNKDLDLCVPVSTLLNFTIPHILSVSAVLILLFMSSPDWLAIHSSSISFTTTYGYTF